MVSAQMGVSLPLQIFQLPMDKKYKNTEKSTLCFFEEPEKILLLQHKNTHTKPEHLKYTLTQKYLQIFYAPENNFQVAFGKEHCKLEINAQKSALVFFKQTPMDLLFSLPENASFLIILIPIKNLHSLFSDPSENFFDFENINTGKPIIETQLVSEKIKNVFEKILRNPPKNNLDKLYTKAKVYELLSVYFKKYQKEHENPCPFIENEKTLAQIKKAKDLIIQNIAQPPSLEALSKKVGINLKKLKTGFKEYYGAPVYAFLLDYKLQKSKKLLLEGNLNINEIATQIGYSNSSHFIAAFKKKFGNTPKQFTKTANP